jgi:hypothetical protein
VGDWQIDLKSPFRNQLLGEKFLIRNIIKFFCIILDKLSSYFYIYRKKLVALRAHLLGTGFGSNAQPVLPLPTRRSGERHGRGTDPYRYSRGTAPMLSGSPFALSFYNLIGYIRLIIRVLSDRMDLAVKTPPSRVSVKLKIISSPGREMR